MDEWRKNYSKEGRIKHVIFYTLMVDAPADLYIVNRKIRTLVIVFQRLPNVEEIFKNEANSTTA